MPKQFVPLIGTSSTFQQVLDRVTRDGLFAPPMIVTNSEFRFVVAEQARSRGVKATIILEPQRRDSAAAIAAATSLIMFAIPFCLLLSQPRKQNPRRLIRVAIWLLCARAVELFWVVEPTGRSKTFTMYWTDVVAFLTVGGIWLYAYLGYLRRRPLLPLHDPRIMPVITEEVAA